MGLSHEENLLDLTPHDLGKGCGSGRLFAVVFPRSRRASFSEFRRASSLKLVRPSATAREHSRSRIAFGEETLTSCLTRVGGPEIEVGAALADRDARALAADRGADARLGEVERDAGKNLDALSEKECHGCSGSLFAGRIQARTAQACAAGAQ